MSLQNFFEFYGAIAAIGVGALLLGIAIFRDMKKVLKLINDNVLAGKQNKNQMLKKLKEFIELHAVIKQLSVTTQDRFSPKL